MNLRLLCCVWLVPAAMMPFASGAEAPFSFDSAPGRLPKDVMPIDYDIAIVPNVDKRTFAGTESVTLEVRSTTGSIVFNTLDLYIHAVKLDGKPIQHFATDNDAQLTTVTLPEPVTKGTHKLTVTYDGVIQTRPQGLFVQPYNDASGRQNVILTTQMEATDARRMFPCWDEPAFRSTFQLTATIPADWASISNMPIADRQVRGKLATVKFQRSPRMPTYLVDFNAGYFRQVSAEHDGVKFGVWAVRGHEHDGETALANAQQILADYNDYFGYGFPLPKLDSIAIPGGFGGAMENWGAITYNSEVLLLSKGSSLDDRQQVYSIQAHEMAHQWNGDLVTMGWWDDLWLNESFASWRAAKETDLRNPSWKWWEGQDVDKESAMYADGQSSSHPIQQHVVDEQQASSAFDPVITYSKGQAVLRMFENYLGPDTFRDGVRRYMKARAFSNATTADLWQALGSASNQDITAVAAGWTEQAGFPVVTVSSHCEADSARTITLTQQRFLLRPATDNGPSKSTAHWSIPLQIRSGAQATARSVLLTRDGQTETAGSCKEPLSVNADAIGFFRAEYDQSTLAIDTHSFGTLPDGDRIALLDDQWALVQAQRAKLPTYLALASAMGSDLDVRAWEQIADALGTIEYDERGTPGHDAFAVYARSILKPVADRLGWAARPEETSALQRLRRTVLQDLGAWGDQDVISEARKRFAAFTRDRNAISADDQSMVLTIVGLYADEPTFEQLHNLARSAKDESELTRLYLALAVARDPGLAAKAAQIALSGELPPQQTILPIRMVTRLANAQPKLAWETFAGHYEVLLKPWGNLSPMELAQETPQWFWNASSMDELQEWLHAHVPTGMDANIEKGMQAGRFKVSEKEALVPAADAYVAGTR